ILEAEISTAVALGKPTIVLLRQETLTTLEQLKRGLERGTLALEPVSHEVPSAPAELIGRHRWSELGRWYRHRDQSEDLSLQRASFLLQLLDGPQYVWLRPIDLRSPDFAVDVLQEVLTQAPRSFTSSPAWCGEEGPIDRMLSSTRNPLAPESLRVLVET